MNNKENINIIFILFSSWKFKEKKRYWNEKLIYCVCQKSCIIVFDPLLRANEKRYFVALRASGSWLFANIGWVTRPRILPSVVNMSMLAIELFIHTIKSRPDESTVNGLIACGHWLSDTTTE
jgi:hypothetical protein